MLSVSCLLLSVSSDTTPVTKKNRESRQSQDPINLCSIDCQCGVSSPERWNQMMCCPAAFGRSTLLNPYGELNDGVMGSQGEGDNFIPNFDGQESGHFEEDNFFSDLGSPESGHLEEDNFISDLGSSERGPLEKDIFDPDPGSAIRKRRSKANDQESHGERANASIIEKTTDTHTRQQSSSCLYPLIYREPLHAEFKERFKKTNKHTMVLMIHSCQYKFIGSELQSKCFDFRNTSSLENVIPVVDRATGRIFANRFCAECSGMNDFNEFTTNFICESKLFGEWGLLSMDRTHDNQMKLIKSGICVYYFTDPNMYNPDNQCIEVRYRHCNQTGKKTCSVCDDSSYQNRHPGYKNLLLSISTQLSIKFILLINFKLLAFLHL